MFFAIIIVIIIVASVAFHFWSPWWWTPVASNWGGMDDTIILTFWVTGTVFIAVCLFMAYCTWRYRYQKDRTAEYKPEDKKLEFHLTWLSTLGNFFLSLILMSMLLTASLKVLTFLRFFLVFLLGLYIFSLSI